MTFEFRERPGAGNVGLGKFHLCLCARYLCLGRLDRNFEWTLVERKEQVAFFDHRAFFEVHLLNEATDAGPKLDACNGLEAARVFVPRPDALGDWRSDGHSKFRRSGLRVSSVS